MVMFDESRLVRLEKTMRAICRSPDVSWYKIGFTSNPSFKRAESHRKEWGFTSFVVLADSLTREQALSLEEKLFTRAVISSEDVLYQKYVDDLRDKGHRRSYGGARPERADELIHSVYMIWANLNDPEPGKKWPEDWRESWST